MPVRRLWTVLLPAFAILAWPATTQAQDRVEVIIEGETLIVAEPGELVQIEIEPAAPPREQPGNAAAADSADPDADNAGPQGEQPQAQPTEQELRERLRQLELQMREVRQQHQQMVAADRQTVQEQGAERVELVLLPADPTREQCAQYIAELREATAGRRSFSSGDPVVDKLRAVPEEHADLLITEMSDHTTLRYYAQYALNDLDPEVMRERIVSTLADSPGHIGVIVMNGWCEDARPIIKRTIESADATLQPAWFQAGVELQDPSLYAKLHAVTIESRYAIQYINLLAMLPDYDLRRTIDACWVATTQGRSPLNPLSLAPLAAEQGRVDALGLLIEQVQSARSYMVSPTAMNPRRAVVLRLIDYRGTNQELKQWFDTNKDKLVFDFVRGRFVVPEAF